MENAETIKMFKRGTVIDPPEGQNYGFPKVLERDIFTCREMKDWIVRKGYPISLLDFYGESFLRKTRIIYPTAAVDATLENLAAEINILKAKVEEYEKKETYEENKRINRVVDLAYGASVVLSGCGHKAYAKYVQNLIEEFDNLREKLK
jgi:hypothetical protein